MKYASLILIFFSSPSLLFSQRNLPSKPMPGICYIRCVTPETYSSYHEDLPVSTGVNAENTDLDTLSIEIRPAGSRWEYKQSTNDCRSPNPADCLMLCHVEYPAQIETYVVVRDTSQTTDYQWTSVEIFEVEDPGGEAVWEEVDCRLTEFNKLPIYFENDSSELDEESKSVIEEELLSLMTEKVNIRVEIASHTDSRGDAQYNRELSLSRAEAVQDYLAEQGISPSRLKVSGYGEERLTNHCKDGVNCSERLHAKNVRTEFRVLSN